MNGAIKVKYSDFNSFSKLFCAYFKTYKTWFEAYLQTLQDIETNSFASGSVHNSLILFRTELARIKDYPDELAASLKKAVQTYLDELDAAQIKDGTRILYGKDFPGYRDYSPSYFNELMKSAESADYNTGVFNSIMDGLEDLVYGFKKFFGKYNNSKQKDIKNTQKAMLQYNDVTRRQLRDIQRRVGYAEEKSASRIRLIQDFTDALQEYIYEFDQIMAKFAYDPMNFNVLNVSFTDKYMQLLRAFNRVVQIDEITDSDMEAFINSDQAETYLYGQVRIIYDFIGNLSKMDMQSLDFWKIVIFQMFDVAEGQIATFGNYSKMVMKKELLDMMNSLADCYTYDGSDEQELLEETKEFLKYYKKYGKNVYKYLNTHRMKNGKLLLDGRTKEAIRFRGFLESLENAGKILEYGDQAIDVLSTLFIDYNRNLEFLESFEKNIQLDGDMKECFDEIKKTYQHDLNQKLEDIMQVIVKNGVQALYTISVGEVVAVVKKTIGIIGEATGESAKTEAQLELMTYGYDIVGKSEAAFNEAVRKLKEADKNSEDYPALVADVKNCFAIYKSSLCRMFEKMAAATDGDQRDYYYYCSSQVASFSLKDFDKNEFLTYEEYLKEGYAH